MTACNPIFNNLPGSAVASFFKPASEKPPEKITWQERGENDKPATLLVGKYVPSDTVDPQSTAPFTLPRRKIAAFDFVRDLETNQTRASC